MSSQEKAEASQPSEQLQEEDWHLWSDEGRATATKFWDTRHDSLRLQIAEVADALSSLSFSDSFKNTGAGPVYAVRAFPPHGPSRSERIQLYEIDPPELSRIIGDDTYSGISGRFEPTRISPDSPTAKMTQVPSNEQHMFSESAELVASDALQLYEPGCTNDAAITSSDDFRPI